MKQILFLSLVAGVVAFSSYTGNNPKKPQIQKGPEVQVHGGKAWTWVQLSKQGNPEKLAIALSDEALNSVPAGTPNSGHGHMEGNHWIVKLPAKTSNTPFNHVSMHWNPNGHEPENIYTLPHFDFHFYSSTPEEVLEIGTYEKDSVRFKKYAFSRIFPGKIC